MKCGLVRYAQTKALQCALQHPNVCCTFLTAFGDLVKKPHKTPNRHLGVLGKTLVWCCNLGSTSDFLQSPKNRAHPCNPQTETLKSRKCPGDGCSPACLLETCYRKSYPAAFRRFAETQHLIGKGPHGVCWFRTQGLGFRRGLGVQGSGVRGLGFRSV